MSKNKSSKLSSRDMSVGRFEKIGNIYGCPVMLGVPSGKDGTEIVKKVRGMFLPPGKSSLSSEESADKPVGFDLN